MQHEEEQSLFQKLEESRLSMPDTTQRTGGLVYDDTVSEAGSLEKEENLYLPKRSSSSSTVYRFLFDDADANSVLFVMIFLLVVSVSQYVPFYMGLDELLPYISCTSNFCIANSLESVESKISTMCRNSNSSLGETHYFSLLHRVLLAYSAIMTNFLSFFGLSLLFFRWNKFFAEFNYFKVVAYFAGQCILFFLNTAIIKMIDWNNMKPDHEYTLLPVDVEGCLNLSVIYSYYRPDDIHNQFWIIAAIYFPLFIISIFRFLWDSIKLHDCREWSFSFLITVVGSSTLAGWIFALIINYAAGIQFSMINDSSEHFRNQWIVNLSLTGLVFLISIVLFIYKRNQPPKDV